MCHEGLLSSNFNGETLYLVGDAMGRAMAKLLETKPTPAAESDATRG